MLDLKEKHNLGGFLSRYDLAYLGRDTVNHAAKVSPRIIKAATNNINNITKQRLNQLISQRAKKVDRVLAKVLRGAIKDIYQTSFRLLRDFGKNQFNKLKQKILK